jgi:hypothetical protein
MNKFPIDEKGVQELASNIVKNHQAQEQLIAKLTDFLRLAMSELDLEDAHEDEDLEWVEDAVRLVESLQKRQIEFANLRFDQSNGHKPDVLSPYEIEVNYSKKVEEEVDKEWSEEELAKHFGEPKPVKKKELTKRKLAKMSLEEIESWEKAQDNSNDIYKVSARVKNLARAAGNLTAQGDMLCNTFTHVLMAFYDFASRLEDKDTKIRLTELTRSKEGMPADFIGAAQANVKVGKFK